MAAALPLPASACGGCSVKSVPSRLRSAGCAAGFCKQQLWPLFHYLLPLSPASSGRFDPDLWQAYVKANKARRAARAGPVRPAPAGSLHPTPLCRAEAAEWQLPMSGPVPEHVDPPVAPLCICCNCGGALVLCCAAGARPAALSARAAGRGARAGVRGQAGGGGGHGRGLRVGARLPPARAALARAQALPPPAPRPLPALALPVLGGLPHVPAPRGAAALAAQRGPDRCGRPPCSPTLPYTLPYSLPYSASARSDLPAAAAEEDSAPRDTAGLTGACARAARAGARTPPRGARAGAGRPAAARAQAWSWCRAACTPPACVLGGRAETQLHLPSVPRLLQSTP